MNCTENTSCTCNKGRTGFVIILVLYILLAILLGGSTTNFY